MVFLLQITDIFFVLHDLSSSGEAQDEKSIVDWSCQRITQVFFLLIATVRWNVFFQKGDRIIAPNAHTARINQVENRIFEGLITWFMRKEVCNAWIAFNNFGLTRVTNPSDHGIKAILNFGQERPLFSTGKMEIVKLPSFESSPCWFAEIDSR